MTSEYGKASVNTWITDRQSVLGSQLFLFWALAYYFILFWALGHTEC